MFNQKIIEAYSKMIISVSGWRSIYDIDGIEGCSGKISEENGFITFLACKYFESFLLSKNESSVIIGTDTRPTCKILLQIANLSFKRLNKKNVNIVAAPEIMAHSKKTKTPFIYFSASHNPIGYNGIKFGLKTGGVLDANDSDKLITSFKSLISCIGETKAKQFLDLKDEFKVIWKNVTSKSLTILPTEKDLALVNYYNFTIETISGFGTEKEQASFCKQFKNAIQSYKKQNGDFCIVYDFNGSSRVHSIDKKIFADFGLDLYAFNENKIEHGIIPESENLKPAASKMAELAEIGKNPLFALMPDCDGDRGNLVFWNDQKKQTILLNAQEVFAICVISELSFIRYMNLTEKPIAVVVNCSTSLRIQKITEAFGAKCFVAEVGEANVVNLAKKLLTQGYFVRILGEGSNGGNITFPANVRDPLNTVFSILKLFLFRENLQNSTCPFKIYCNLLGQEYSENFNLVDLISKLPNYTTTETQMPRAILQIKQTNQELLKKAYQHIFLLQWNDKKSYLREKYNITRYEVLATKGSNEFSCEADFSKSGTGGLKILFYAVDEPIAFIWMRGSKTEPIFRIMADIKGDLNAEKELVGWQKEMLTEADNLSFKSLLK